MRTALTALALLTCSCQRDLDASDLGRLTEFWGCCHSWFAGWSDDGDLVFSVDMPAVDEPGEYLEQFGDSAVVGILRSGKNFGDGVRPLDTGQVFHENSVTREKLSIVSGSATIKRTPWDSWYGEGQPGCNGLDVLDLILTELVFESEDGLRSFNVDSFEFPPLCVGWMPM